MIRITAIIAIIQVAAAFLPGKVNSLTHAFEIAGHRTADDTN